MYSTVRQIMRLCVGALIVALLVAFSGVSPVAAASIVDESQLGAEQLLRTAFVAPNQAGSAYIQITGISHGITRSGLKGMEVNLYATADGLQGSRVRFGLFFYYSSNDASMRASSSAPSKNKTSSGYLTWQEVVTVKYSSSVWNSIKVFMPYSYFPSTSGRSVSCYALAAMKIDGDSEWPVESGREYFNLTK